MEENHASALESIANGDHHDAGEYNSHSSSNNNDHGWQKVTYQKRQRKNKAAESINNQNRLVPGAVISGGDSVFRGVEKEAEERVRRRQEAQRAAAAANADAIGVVPARSKHRSDDEYGEDSDDEAVPQNAKEAGEEKKSKPKKPKKPKVTVAEAAAKIDVNALTAELIQLQQFEEHIQVMKLADFFGRAFSAVTSAQFPWVKMFKESTVAKIADIPISHIPEDIYKTSIDWISQRSIQSLGSFILESLDQILADLASQRVGGKGAKKGVQQASSKSQVAVFTVVAMVLRRKPDVLISILPTLRENSKYQGQDNLPVIVWMIVQASQGDLAVGLYAWARNVLPLVCGKNSNPQSRDLVLQLVERILSMPKARTILVNGAVRKGERLVPPSALEILIGVTFPAPSARVKATERFEAVYPTLKDVALAGSQGSKAMKQVSQQILSFAVKAAGEASTPELSNEAAGIFIWCLTQSAECFRQWDKVYEGNLRASVTVLKKLSDQWKEHAAKISPLDPMRETLRSFRHKNEKALEGEAESAEQERLVKDADKYCKTLLGKLSRSSGCKKSVAFIVLALAIGAAVVSPNMESWDWNKLTVFFSSENPFL